MRHLLALLAILAFAVPVYAAEPTDTDAAIAEAVALPAAEAEPADADAPAEPTADEAPVEGELTWWQQALIAIIGLVGAWFTKQAASTGKKKAATYEARAAKEGQEAKLVIVNRVKAFLWRRVAAIQEENLPELASAIVKGQISGEMVKDRLKSFANKLKLEAVEYFDRQDIDVIGQFGEEQVNSWIRSAVDELSVFKKWPTAKVLLEGGAEALLAVGVNKAGEYYDDMRTKIATGETVPTGGAASKVAEKVDAAIKADLKVE